MLYSQCMLALKISTKLMYVKAMMLDKKNALCTLVTILIGINYSKNVHPLVSYLRTAIRNNPRTNSHQGQLVQPELLLPGHEKKQPGVKKCFSERRSGSGEILRGISIRSEMSLGTGDLGDEDKQTTTLIPPSPAPATEIHRQL